MSNTITDIDKLTDSNSEIHGGCPLIALFIVTHDDRILDVADRLIELEDGKLL